MNRNEWDDDLFIDQDEQKIKWRNDWIKKNQKKLEKKNCQNGKKR